MRWFRVQHTLRPAFNTNWAVCWCFIPLVHSKKRDKNCDIIIIFSCGAVSIIQHIKVMSRYYGRFVADALPQLSSNGRANKPWMTMGFYICRRYNSRWWSRKGCWSVDARVSGEMGRSNASSPPCQMAASQRTRYGPRGRLMEVCGVWEKLRRMK